MSKSLWNPKFKRKGDDSFTIPADNAASFEYITQEQRDAANDRLNAMIHAHHIKLGNVKESVADDESDED